jgi:hypothetical protein
MWRARCGSISRDPALALLVTSPHTPRLRARLFSLVALRSTINFSPSAFTDATVFTVQSISSLHAFRNSAPTYTTTSPTTDIALTSMRAHLERNLTSLQSWRRSPACLATVVACLSLSREHSMHRSSFAHTKFISLSQFAIAPHTFPNLPTLSRTSFTLTRSSLHYFIGRAGSRPTPAPILHLTRPRSLQTTRAHRRLFKSIQLSRFHLRPPPGLHHEEGKVRD